MTHSISRYDTQSATETVSTVKPTESRAIDSSKSTQSLYVSVEYVKYHCLSQAVVTTLLAPMDRVQSIMLVQKELHRTGALHTELMSSLRCVKYLVRTEGKRSLWRGNFIQLVSILPTILAQLFIALPMENLIISSTPCTSQSGFEATGFAASLGGAVAASMISYPLDYVHFRLAVDLRSPYTMRYSFRHSLDFFASRVFTEAPHLLYTGFGVYILGSVVYRAMHHLLFSMIDQYIPPVAEDNYWRPIIIQNMCGLSVACTATAGLHPLNLIRRRMMVAVMRNRFRYASAMQCARTILYNEGVRGLYRGWAVTMTRLIAATQLHLLIQQLRS